MCFAQPAADGKDTQAEEPQTKAEEPKGEQQESALPAAQEKEDAPYLTAAKRALDAPADEANKKTKAS